MRLLLSAYQVLSDPEKRRDYDRINRHIIYTSTFNYREYLSKRRDDPQSMGKLIFFDLLHDNEFEAISLYNELKTQSDFKLSEGLDREDYMDCAFLLAEEYEKQGSYFRSFLLYRDLARCEAQKPYFFHFFREVIDRLRAISCFKLPGRISNENLIVYLQELADFDFSPTDTAYFLKRIAEVYAEENSLEQALRYLDKGLKLHADLPGVKKLKERLSYS